MNWIVKGIGGAALCGAVFAAAGCSKPDYSGSVGTYFGAYDGSYSAAALTPTIGTIVGQVDSSNDFTVTLYGNGGTAATASASGTVNSATGVTSGTATINSVNYPYTGTFTANANGATGFNVVLNVTTSPASVWDISLVPNGNTVAKARPNPSVK